MSIWHDDEPWQTDVDLSADDRVKAVVLDDIRARYPRYGNFHICDEMAVAEVLGNDGYYGCDTGCIQPYLEVRVVCPHRPQGQEATSCGDVCDTLSDFIDRMARV